MRFLQSSARLSPILLMNLSKVLRVYIFETSVDAYQ